MAHPDISGIRITFKEYCATSGLTLDDVAKLPVQDLPRYILQHDYDPGFGTLDAQFRCVVITDLCYFCGRHACHAIHQERPTLSPEPTKISTVLTLKDG
jgi:hypothetical protein